jgi:hypothetical protein
MWLLASIYRSLESMSGKVKLYLGIVCIIMVCARAVCIRARVRVLSFFHRLTPSNTESQTRPLIVCFNTHTLMFSSLQSDGITE